MNPYLDEFLALQGVERFGRFDFPRLPAGFFDARNDLVIRYAWAVPNEAALDAISALKRPLVEIGSGKGYWAWMLGMRGVRVHAYDVEVASDLWFPVLRGDVDRLDDHPDAALFLCWPPSGEPLAAACLKRYRGDTVVYVGEGDGGCTGDDEFHRTIESEFTEVSRVEIPQYWGLHDNLLVYKRRSQR